MGKEWIGNEGKIGLDFDVHGKVSREGWLASTRIGGDRFWDKVRSWIGFAAESKPMISIPANSSGNY
jgi:hypothetical protein